MFSKLFAKRSFSSTLFNYSNASNPRACLTVSQGGNPVGNLVFELYADRQPSTVSNFQEFMTSGYAGSSITSGFAGLGFKAGNIAEENVDCTGARGLDEDLSVRHAMRGNLTMVNDGTNANGSGFMVTFGEAPMLDGYNTCFGNLVEGEDVLAKIEANTNRLGEVAGDFSISEAK